MLGIQQPKDTLVVCKRALTKIDKLAQKTVQFPENISATVRDRESAKRKTAERFGSTWADIDEIV